MKARHVVLTTIATTVVGAFAGGSSAANNFALVIRHQVRGCHTWSVNGGPFNASQSIVLRTGSQLTIMNNDVMPHKLVKVAGPSVRFVNLRTGMTGPGMGSRGRAAPGAMAHMGASTRVVFAKAGVYRFVTRAGEDYMSGMKTIGEDNVLRLTVTVT